MKTWEKLAQTAMLEPDAKRALELYEEAKKEAIRSGAMKGDNDE